MTAASATLWMINYHKMFDTSWHIAVKLTLMNIENATRMGKDGY